MTRHVFALAVCAMVLLRPTFTTAADNDQPAPQVMTLYPAAAPRPALVHRLLPPVLKQISGNAAPLYLKAFLSQAQSPLDAAGQKKLSTWLALPLEELPRDEVRALLDTRTGVLHQMALAARRTECDWALPLREEKNWFEIQLPELQEARTVAKLLSLRARLEAAEGRFSDAVVTLQQGFALARHVAAAPTLVNGLVGAAIVRLQADALEAIVQAPQSPNLHWALAVLPEPIVDLSASVAFEAEGIYFLYPELAAARTQHLTTGEWDTLLSKLCNSSETLLPLVQAGGESAIKLSRPGELKEQLLGAAPQARQWLITQGLAADVEAMTPAQAALMAATGLYDERRDAMLCRWAVPFWQMNDLPDPKSTLSKHDPLQLFGVMLADLSRVRQALVGTQQRIAVLQCLEALRLHAATSGGKLPATLGEIQGVVLPISPVTGQPFEYRLDGETAVLVAPSADDKPARTYHVTMKRAE